MPFQEFTQKSERTSDEPTVTVQKPGMFALNEAAHEALGRPEHVVLLFDPEERMIGFRAALEDVPHAYSVRSVKGTRNLMVTGKAFCAKWSIPTDRARRYPAEMRDDILTVSLKNGAAVPARQTRAEKLMAVPGSTRDVTRAQ